MSRIVLVRHGKAADQWNDYDHLSELGVAQAKRLAERLVHEEPEAARGFHGTLRRQRQTAEAVANTFAAHGHTLSLRTLGGLDEMAHGVVEAALAAEPATPLRDQIGAWLVGQRQSSAETRAFMVHAYLRYAEGALQGDFEPYVVFRQRVTETLAQCGAEPGTALVFTSGGVIATALGLALGAEAVASLRTMAVLENTSISELRYSRRHRHYTLVRVNDVHHLERAMRSLL